MVKQYFVKKINLEKINDLNDYLIKNNFKSLKNEYGSSFRNKFSNNVWANKAIETEIRIHNDKYNLSINTPFDEKGNPQKKDLINKIMEITEADILIDSFRTLVSMD
jgi:hypothetical protein